MCDQRGQATAIRQANSSQLTLAGLNISTVQGLPSQATSMYESHSFSFALYADLLVLCRDLSSNAIQALNLSTTGVVTLNLQRNSIASILSLPPTLETLDLSYNAIGHLSLAAFDWRTLPKLKSLNLRGNGIRSFYYARFPASLQSLDLSENPFEEFAIDSSTLKQFRDAKFKQTLNLTASMVQTITSKCSSYAIVQLINLSVCYESNILTQWEESSAKFHQIGSVFNMIFILMVVLLAVHAYGRFKARQISALENMEVRTTASSSCEALDLEPIQYRETLTQAIASSYRRVKLTTLASFLSTTLSTAMEFKSNGSGRGPHLNFKLDAKKEHQKPCRLALMGHFMPWHVD
ncbi:hypothetical protein AeMF1_014295 [Aphanomyces euteiches]|nr:hypothetical protein AeMF1_014295 [Aphanomyces euteiches]KAH9182027.1 hypothetical protein AeNC1_015996 [Aphanomyces euteiches]